MNRPSVGFLRGIGSISRSCTALGAERQAQKIAANQQGRGPPPQRANSRQHLASVVHATTRYRRDRLTTCSNRPKVHRSAGLLLRPGVERVGHRTFVLPVGLAGWLARPLIDARHRLEPQSSSVRTSETAPPLRGGGGGGGGPPPPRARRPIPISGSLKITRAGPHPAGPPPPPVSRHVGDQESGRLGRVPARRLRGARALEPGGGRHPGAEVLPQGRRAASA